ncbi:TetR/AcrR family transcriptional regulator [Paractinoplanes ferrugineus]|uniref:TetR family transcriptional regulator n=1 Tax=Paractinoplanes ferrugineus TaxID=113564 RepID=A0A919J4D1_9ACTN|nr:TetR/AcrR family transcriptional regulator [Actinoplanes ferrugineus]GIE10371.1 TetR family transcriptional regulator [Actinoplanes ferrugineus]
MPRNSERGGPLTRARISTIAARLFLEHGFDNVTVAQVAKEAGVSSVTVFNHFPRKEDLFLDRSTEATELLRTTVRDRAPGLTPVAALRRMTLALVDSRHPLSGADDRSVPFFRTVAASPALLARAREIGYELQRALAEELGPESDLLAAFFVAGYSTIMVDTARRLIAGEPHSTLLADHRARFEHLFAALAAATAPAGQPRPGTPSGG